MTKPSVTHMTLGYPTTVCGKRREEVLRLTRELKDTTCKQCLKHAPKRIAEFLLEQAKVSPAKCR